MIEFIAGSVATLLLLALLEWRRSARIAYMERAERMRVRLSHLRHQLVLFGGTAMKSEDRRAFEFLYGLTTLLLRYPRYYQQISTSVCFAFMDGAPRRPPRIKKRDISSRTRPFLEDCVRAADDLVQQFAHPILLILAFLSRKRVLEWARERGRQMSEFHEILEERKVIEEYRQLGARALRRTT